MNYELSTVTYNDYEERGFLVVQVQMNGGTDSTSDSYEHHHTFGFFSRPMDRDPDGTGCQAFVGHDGDEGHVTLSYDPRYVDGVPNPGKGGSVQYGASGAFSMIKGDDGTQTVYVPYAGGTKALTFVMDPNQEAISMIHSNGTSLILNNDGALLKSASGAQKLFLDDSGINLAGSIKLAGGVVAGDVAAALPVALAPALLAWMAAVNAAITAICTQLAAPGPVAGNPGQTAVGATLVTATGVAGPLLTSKALSGT